MNLKRLIVHTPILRLVVLMALSASALATTAVTGHITRLDTTTPGATAYVRFWLRGTRGNQPRITGTGAIAPQFSGSAFYVDLPADASGNISGTIYSTRDSTGTGAGDIEAGGSYTAVYYGMQVFNSGIAGPESPVHAKSGGALDIANVTPVSTLPVITSPTGDSTYARIDGGNTPFSGAVSFGSTINATHGGTLGGAFTGSATLNFTNAGIFTNTQQNLYLQSLLGGCNPTSQWNSVFNLPNHATEASTFCGVIASGATVFQENSVGAYVENQNGATTAGVAVFGMATASTTVDGRVWGANFLATDVAVTKSQSLYSAENDCNLQSTTSVCHGLLITGFWKAQPTISVGVEIGPIQQGSGCTTCVWPYGIRFDQGATNAPGTSNAAVYFFPVTSGSSQPSQGMTFLGSSSGGTQDMTATQNLDAVGNLAIATTAANSGILLNNKQVTRSTATGTATVDLASVATAACTADSSDVTLTGAAVGDPVRVTAATALPAGVWLIGRVTASNTGRFQLCNLSGGAVDRASDTYTISVVK